MTHQQAKVSFPDRLPGAGRGHDEGSVSASPSRQSVHPGRASDIDSAPLGFEANLTPETVHPKEPEQSQPGHVQNGTSQEDGDASYLQSWAIMTATMVIGVAACVGHHFLNWSLRGQSANADAQENYFR